MPGTAITCSGGTLTTAGSAYPMLVTHGSAVDRRIWNTSPLAGVFANLGGTARLGQGPFIPPLEALDLKTYTGAVSLCADIDAVVVTFVEV